MISAMSNTAQRLDWRGWFLGIMSSVIAGGSGAVSAAFGTALVDWRDPDHFALQPGHLFYTMAICFVVSGVIALMTYLHNHPIPGDEPATPPVTPK